MIDPVLHITCRTGLALLFAIAALHKWSDQRRFIATLGQYRAMPKAIVPLSAGIVMVFEPLVAIALIIPALHRVAALAAVALLGVYSIAIALNLLRGRREIDCGCFGASARASLSWWLVARNAALLLVTAVILLPQTARSLHWIDTITVLTATGTLALLWAASQRLLLNWPALRKLA